jgi:hypothetical protein
MEPQATSASVSAIKVSLKRSFGMGEVGGKSEFAKDYSR